jgi:hypothetical protein
MFLKIFCIDFFYVIYVYIKKQSIIGIPVNYQNLACGGVKLEDEQSITDYGLEKGSVIDLLPTMEIYIKTQGEK